MIPLKDTIETVSSMPWYLTRSNQVCFQQRQLCIHVACPQWLYEKEIFELHSPKSSLPSWTRGLHNQGEGGSDAHETWHELDCVSISTSRFHIAFRTNPSVVDFVHVQTCCMHHNWLGSGFSHAHILVCDGRDTVCCIGFSMHSIPGFLPPFAVSHPTYMRFERLLVIGPIGVKSWKSYPLKHDRSMGKSNYWKELYPEIPIIQFSTLQEGSSKPSLHDIVGIMVTSPAPAMRRKRMNMDLSARCYRWKIIE